MVTTEDAVVLVLIMAQTTVVISANRRRRRVMDMYRVTHPYARLERPQLPETKAFGENYPDANAEEDFRLTLTELKLLAEALNIPESFRTRHRDRCLYMLLSGLSKVLTKCL